MILMTEWKEFRSPDFFEMGKLLSEKIIFDGRNQYDSVFMKKNGWEYHYVGMPGNLENIFYGRLIRLSAQTALSSVLFLLRRLRRAQKGCNRAPVTAAIRTVGKRIRAKVRDIR